MTGTSILYSNDPPDLLIPIIKWIIRKSQGPIPVYSNLDVTDFLTMSDTPATWTIGIIWR